MNEAGVAGRERRVLLICPPYQHLRLSSLSVALLATWLRERGVVCEEAYLHFELARRMGRARYDRLSDGVHGLIGELLFAEGLHGELPDPEARARLTELCGDPAEREAQRSALGADCLRWMDAAAPELVGLTTSLNQLLPALFLARVIKAHHPEVRIVLGGSGCAEPMGSRLVATYPEIDYVVSGAGEQVLLALARGAAPDPRVLNGARAEELDSLPIPDYRVLLEQAGEFADDPRFMLAFEASRGCWWGRKHHCRFCGLNGDELAFSTKSSSRVLAEIGELFRRHGKPLFATDTILAVEHLRRVIPALGETDEGPRLFWEVKANLAEADVRALRRARVLAIQPGIESLSSRLLAHLGKGIDGIRNLALLKWCREQGIAVAWNQLCAIPGETTADYQAQIELMRRIPQLPPPECVNPIRIDRYSPYFERHRDFGWARLSPLPEYSSLHPTLGPGALDELAYHFNGEGGVSPVAYLDELVATVSDWQRRHQRGDGLFLDAEHGLFRNEDGKCFRFQLHAGLARVLDLTHQVTSLERMLELAQCPEGAIEPLVAAGILHVEGGRVLNLAVRLGAAV